MSTRQAPASKPGTVKKESVPNSTQCRDTTTGAQRLSRLPGSYEEGCAKRRPEGSASPPPGTGAPEARAAAVEADARAARELGWQIEQSRDTSDQPIWTVVTGPVDPHLYVGVHGLDSAERVMRAIRNAGAMVGPARQSRILSGYRAWVRREFVPPSHEQIGRGYAPVRRRGPLHDVGQPMRALSTAVAVVTSPVIGTANPLALGARAAGALVSPTEQRTERQNGELERAVRDFGTFNQYMTENHPDVSEAERRRMHSELR